MNRALLLFCSEAQGPAGAGTNPDVVPYLLPAAVLGVLLLVVLGIGLTRIVRLQQRLHDIRHLLRETLQKEVLTAEAQSNLMLALRLSDPKSDRSDVPSSPELAFVLQVKELVKQHLDDPTFNVNHLCLAMHMSRTTLFQRLKALTGMAPAEFIRVERLNQAKRLLREGRYNITEVAERTGFYDAKYFREVFKKYYHMTPSEYINQLT